MGLFDHPFVGSESSIGSVAGNDFLHNPDATSLTADSIIAFAAEQLQSLDQTISDRMNEQNSNLDNIQQLKAIQSSDFGYNADINDIQSGLTADAELSMIQLQSVVSQRQQAIQLTTNLMDGINESARQIAQNMRDGGPSHAGPSSQGGTGASHPDTPADNPSMSDGAGEHAGAPDAPVPPADADNPPDHAAGADADPPGVPNDGAAADGRQGGIEPVIAINDAINPDNREAAAAGEASDDHGEAAGHGAADGAPGNEGAVGERGPDEGGQPVPDVNAAPAAPPDALEPHNAAPAANGLPADDGSDPHNPAAMNELPADDGSNPHNPAADAGMPAPDSDGHGSPISDAASHSGLQVSDVLASHRAESSIIIGGLNTSSDDASGLGHDPGRGLYLGSFWDQAADASVSDLSSSHMLDLSALSSVAAPSATEIAGVSDHGLTASGLSMADLAHGADMAVARSDFGSHAAFAAEDLNPQPLPPGPSGSHDLGASHFDLGASHIADISHLNLGSLQMHM